MKTKLLLFAAIIFISYAMPGQSTFLRVIDNIKDEESVTFISEITPGKYLCGIHQINPNSIFPLTDFGYINVLYLFDDMGNITDSLKIDKLDEYCIIVWKVIRAENDDILFLCLGRHSTTSDIQLCLLYTDFNLEIISYGFFGSPDTSEYITDYCVNYNQNIVFAGNTGYLSIEDIYFLLWETDFAGNTINYKIDTNYFQANANILELQGVGKYYVGNGGNGVFICNYNLEVETFKLFKSDTTGFIGMPFKKHKLVDGFHFLMLGWQINNGNGTFENPWDMAFYKMDESFHINKKYIYGAIDTNDFPNNIDFIDTNRIFFGGVKNYTNQPPEDSWLSLYITNLQGDTINSRYYGGYGSYNVGTGLATCDGGYIFGVRWFDFANYIPPEPIDWDVIIMKVDADGLISNVETPMPFKVTDVIVYPNPANNEVNFVLGLYSNLQLSIYNSTGERMIFQSLYHSQTIDISSFPSGMYVYLLTGKNGFTETGKIIKY
jgi:hypothetical protein